MKILVVEPDAYTCRMWGRWLATEHEVSLAFYGADALEQFHDDLDLIILDSTLPDRSAADVLTTLRDREWNGQAIMITADPPDIDSLWSEFDDYLVEPFERTELLRTVEKHRHLRAHEERIQEYLQLLATRNAIEERGNATGASHPDQSTYETVIERIEAIEAELEPVFETLDEDELIALGIRDLWYDDSDGRSNEYQESLE